MKMKIEAKEHFKVDEKKIDEDVCILENAYIRRLRERELKVMGVVKEGEKRAENGRERLVIKTANVG